ncbi:MAG: hypothetical protein Faunusvirus59_3 [Faunusvirus sp.]|jgi:hypothetical protein|uniref:Uncharacterized protein n=1 Tax=Faunusvirus sp. TaxID=2487766 RepID=A0A3G4ZY27_9VIRU|nr:MAG: hypothetical protein Faunusvirus59_3 [Faunusvirus sp.]
MASFTGFSSQQAVVSSINKLGQQNASLNGSITTNSATVTGHSTLSTTSVDTTGGALSVTGSGTVSLTPTSTVVVDSSSSVSLGSSTATVVNIGSSNTAVNVSGNVKANSATTIFGVGKTTLTAITGAGTTTLTIGTNSQVQYFTVNVATSYVYTMNLSTSNVFDGAVIYLNLAFIGGVSDATVNIYSGVSGSGGTLLVAQHTVTGSVSGMFIYDGTATVWRRFSFAANTS